MSRRTTRRAARVIRSLRMLPWLLAGTLVLIATRVHAVAQPRGDHGDAAAPLPDQAHGIARPERKRGKQALWIPRTILYVPKRAVTLALTPVRLGMWAYERYRLEDLFYRVFFFEGRSFGLYPTARFQSQFGASVGGRMVHDDLFHNGGSLDIDGLYGGKFGQRLSFDMHSGWLGGSPVRVGLTGSYRSIPADPFYGLGNADGAKEPREGAVDPWRRGPAVSSRFSHEYLRAGPVLAFRLARALRLELSSIYTWRRLGVSTRAADHAQTEDAFRRDRLVGYDQGVSNVASQLDLRVDTRRHRRTAAIVSSGWYASVYGGYTVGIDRDPSSYGRVGFDVQRFVDLFNGDRVLRVRLAVDSAIGSLRRIPFVELPSLGGSSWLRGYSRARFRDRVAALATFEYTYPIDSHLAGFFFAEPGRVWSGTEPFELRHVRLGWGGGFQLHTRRKFLARLQLASTIDGGFHVYLLFSPPSELRDHP